MQKDLLFCIFAVQSGFISSSELTEIQSGWAADPSKSILERLKSKIEPEQMELLDKLVSFALKKHGSPEKTLSALENRDLVLKTLGGTMAKVDDSPAVVSSVQDVEDVTIEQSGRYTLKGEKGRGGIGRVLIAFDEHIGRDIAVKELLGETEHGSGEHTPQSSPTSPVNIRFLREARVTGQLEHPGIVPVYEIGKRCDGTLYYTMRLVKGKNLSQAIKESKTLHERLKLLTHFHDLCNAVAYAHSRGVIHRDIKPENVMIGEFGETVVLDWGLAKIKGEKDEGAQKLEKGLEALKNLAAGVTVAGHAMGTPSYMPPEQALGEIEEIDEKSDIYSIGAVLYEILTGETPHSGMSAYDIIAKVVSNEIIPVNQKDASIPKELGAIAEKALQKKKIDRYQSALELAEDVEGYLSGGKVTAYEYSSWELMKRFVAKNRAITIIGALFIFFVLLSSFVIYQKYQDEMTARQISQQNEIRIHQVLSETFLDKAIVAYKDFKYMDAQLYAIHSLKNSPMNPYGNFKDKFEPTEQEMHSNSKAYSIFNDAKLNGMIKYSSSIATNTEAGKGKLLMSPDKKHFLRINRSDIELYSLETMKMLNLIETDNKYYGATVSFSNDGKSFFYSVEESKKIVRVAIPDLSKQVHDDSYLQKLEIKSLLSVPESEDIIIIAENGLKNDIIARYDLNSAKLIWEHKLSTLNRSYIVSEITPDGKTVVMSGPESGVLFFDVKEKKETVARGFHVQSVSALSLSPHGKFLVSGSYDKKIVLWDIQSKKVLTTLSQHKAAVSSVAFMSDRHFFSASTDGEIVLWDLGWRKIEEIFYAGNQNVSSIAVSLEHKVLISAGDSDLMRVWKYKENASKMRKVTQASALTINSLSFSPDGKHIAFDNNKDVLIWDVEKDVLKSRFFTESGRVRSFSKDGARLIMGTELFNIENIEKPTGMMNLAPATGFFPIRNGNFVAWKSYYDTLLHIIDTKDGNEIYSLDLELKGSFANSSASEKAIIVFLKQESNEIVLIDVEKRSSKTVLLKGIGGNHQDIEIFPDATKVITLTGENKIVIYDITESPAKVIKLIDAHDYKINGASISPDGKIIASFSNDMTLKLWNSNDGKLLRQHIFDRPAGTVAFSPDSSKYAIAYGTSILFYDVADFDPWTKNPEETLKRLKSETGKVIYTSKVEFGGDM